MIKTLAGLFFLLFTSTLFAQSSGYGPYCYMAKVNCIPLNPFYPEPPGAVDHEYCDWELRCDTPSTPLPNLPGSPNCPPACYPNCPLPLWETTVRPQLTFPGMNSSEGLCTGAGATCEPTKRTDDRWSTSISVGL